MTAQHLFENILRKKSFLCVGLDTEKARLPACLRYTDDPVFEFNRRIIDATAPYAVAYKPNVAFYEANGSKGWDSLIKTIGHIREKYPDCFVIADAKRGDIGNTSKAYASAFFEHLDADAVTVAPYMGEDSVTPFLAYDGKWVILLALTSNKGADDFQYHTENGERLFERVLRISQKWGSTDNMMYVVGATRAGMLGEVRKLVPDHFLLVPGIGTQGGSLGDVVKHGMNSRCGLLVNSSRGIVYADSTEKFDIVAAEQASAIQAEMEGYLRQAFLKE